MRPRLSEASRFAAGTPAALLRRLRAERGYTLIELLGAMVLSLVVIVGPLYFIVVSIRQQNLSSSRTAASHRAETGLEQLTRDLRQAMSQDAAGNPLHVNISQTATTTTISFSIPSRASVTTPTAISWTCPSTAASAAANCTRTLGSASSTPITGARSIAWTNAAGTALSLPAVDPPYIGVALSVQVTSQLDPARTQTTPGISNPVLVQTGVDLRNFG